jgi:phenylalanyl-tRNA synthetase beta chain
VEAEVRRRGGALLAEVQLFDVYQGAPLSEEEKSLAYRLLFRSPDRSLTSEEVDELLAGIVEHVSRALGARLR